MPEQAENTVVQEDNQSSEEQLEISRNMAFAFDKDMPQNIAPEIPSTTEPIVNTIVEEVRPIDISTILKENFGVESLDDAKAQWAELQEIKNNPPKIKYENEVSEQIQNALVAGKLDEVYDILDKQMKITRLTSSEINKEAAEEIVKLDMKSRYPTLNQTEINHKYNKQFGLPKEPVQQENELDIDFEERKSDWDNKVKELELDLLVEAKTAIPNLEKLKTEIKFPTVVPQQAEVNKDFEAWKASQSEVSKTIAEVINPAIKALSITDVNLGVKVSDANNQMEFDIPLVPTTDDFEKARQDSLSFDNFISRVCYDKEGNFLPQNVQRLILLNDNFDNYAQSIARQAVNAERKRVIEKETGVTVGNREIGSIAEKSELQKLMENQFN